MDHYPTNTTFKLLMYMAHKLRDQYSDPIVVNMFNELMAEALDDAIKERDTGNDPTPEKKAE